MKKKFLALTLCLLLAVGLSACASGSAPKDDSSQSAADGSAGQDNGDSPENGDLSQNLPSIPGIGDNSSQNTPDGSSTLTDWYNSEERTLLETTMNELFSEAGMRFTVGIEEPDILIYNYQYDAPADAATIEANLPAAIPSLTETIRTYQAMGLPLRVIRMNYMDAEGSMIYTLDVTEDFDLSRLPDTPAAADEATGLDAWMESAEAASVIETVNNQLAALGITIDLAADGNVFVYKYYLPDEFLPSLTAGDGKNFFTTMVNSGSASISSIFTTFEKIYGITIEAVRFIFYSSDGTELYSTDVTL